MQNMSNKNIRLVVSITSHKDMDLFITENVVDLCWPSAIFGCIKTSLYLHRSRISGCLRMISKFTLL